MKANPDKCHLPINQSCKKDIKIACNMVENSKCEELLGIRIDSSLNFEVYMDHLCKKASRKVNMLARIPSYMDVPITACPF